MYLDVVGEDTVWGLHGNDSLTTQLELLEDSTE